MILPPTTGGPTYGWKKFYLSFTSDFGDATVRVATFKAGAWTTQKLSVTAGGGRVGFTLDAGTQKGHRPDLTDLLGGPLFPGTRRAAHATWPEDEPIFLQQWLHTVEQQHLSRARARMRNTPPTGSRRAAGTPPPRRPGRPRPTAWPGKSCWTPHTTPA
ncbi:hypothetical protein ACIP4T_09705 [Streptomyces massasporeus]|uniref:hypothetical protein n=1 Tax=Streptomyces massasporeus TaxID=67324 RepID=UPI0036A4D18F